MSIGYRASFQIIHPNIGGGSGVAIWRDGSNRYIYIATAYHVVEQVENHALVCIDYKGFRHNDYRFIVLDKTYDFALIELRGVPSYVPHATLLTPYADKVLLPGDNIYVVGWPLAIDANSVSNGALRSCRWTLNGTMNQVLVSAPVFGGNSGGGVFLARTHQLLGVVSWGVTNGETMNGVVPYTVIYEALMYFMYKPTVVNNFDTPFPTCGESYLFGVDGIKINSSAFQFGFQPQHPELGRLGSAGIFVLSVLPDSPASDAGLASLVVDQERDLAVYDVVWGVRRPGKKEFIMLTEENSLDMILYNFYTNIYRRQRRYLSSRALNTNRRYTAYGRDLPDTLDIEVLTSHVIDDMFDQTYQIRPVRLVKRHVYYSTHEQGKDPSVFQNEFLCKSITTNDNTVHKNVAAPTNRHGPTHALLRQLFQHMSR